jgi:hypothetical protein
MNRSESETKTAGGPASSVAEPVAWMRRWCADGVEPVKGVVGRKLLPVTVQKCLENDVPLYASPPEGAVRMRERFEEWAQTMNLGVARNGGNPPYDFYLIDETGWAWRAWQAALSDSAKPTEEQKR